MAASLSTLFLCGCIGFLQLILYEFNLLACQLVGLAVLEWR